MARQFRIEAKDEVAMSAFGESLAVLLRDGDCLLLEGDLGAGKTTLARAIVEAMTGETEVPSPTYTLVQTYSCPDVEVWHADLYRLEAPHDVHPLGLLDVMDEVVSLIEWPDRLGELRPLDALTVRIGFDGQGRSVVLEAPDHSDWGERLERADF